MFSFDTELMASTAYRNCFTSLVRQNLHRRKPEVPPRNDGASIITLKQYNAEEVPAKPLAAVADTRAPALDGKAASQTKEEMQDQLEVKIPKPPNNPVFACALCDYEDGQLHLSFRKGDIIQVITQLESGWWYGALHGTSGWFPRNYCTIVQVDDASSLEDQDSKVNRTDDLANTSRTQTSFRDPVIREFVHTERKYVQDLENLHELKKAIEQNAVITDDIIHDIFLNINTILDFQRRFLINIEFTKSQPEKQKWGQIFIAHEEAFGIYRYFIANQWKAVSIARREFDKISKANYLVVVDFNTLEGLLLKPMQRLAEYLQFLKVRFAQIDFLLFKYWVLMAYSLFVTRQRKMNKPSLNS